MSSMDKLKASIAELIEEATTSLTAAISAAQAASHDPVIDALDAQVTAATAKLRETYALLNAASDPATDPMDEKDPPLTADQIGLQRLAGEGGGREEFTITAADVADIHDAGIDPNAPAVPGRTGQ